MIKEQFDISTSQLFSTNEGSPLNILYNDFAESSKSSNPKVTAMTKDLRRMLQQVSVECTDDIMDRVSLLCEEYQREGFLVGVRTGVEFISEISR